MERGYVENVSQFRKFSRNSDIFAEIEFRLLKIQLQWSLNKNDVSVNHVK